MHIEELDFIDPLKICQAFAERSGTVFLDSAISVNANKLTSSLNISEPSVTTNQYSYIAVDPFKIIASKNGKITINEFGNQWLHLTTTVIDGNPWEIMQQHIARYQLAPLPELPPFIGGAAGYFGYELYQHLENINLPANDDMQFADLYLGFYDLVISFDLHTRRAWLCSSGFPELNAAKRQQRAVARASIIKKILSDQYVNIVKYNGHSSLTTSYTSQIISNFSAVAYQTAVQKVKDYILAGDIFEANIAQRFMVKLPAKLAPFQLYCRLRSINPAPFAAYLYTGDSWLVSASPERFLHLQNNLVETCPIKGTRKRSADPKQDQLLQTELLASSKDLAENVMIVDLMRNDLSKVCKPHSIAVPKLCELQTFATVHHLVSVINGELLPEYTALNLLQAAFPGGSITGAPKIRSMEIINEIEQVHRGPYCGSIGYLGFNDNMDTSITIRTFAIKRLANSNSNITTFHAGGAVVLDSDPAEEYAETLAKAHGLIQAL